MSFTTQSQSRAGSAAHLGGFVAELKQRYAQYRLYRQTLNELSALTDRELNDLGLSRSILRRIAYEAAYS
ncbi:DUF1127 domain-containing protein [Litoreibacter roseus]|uniref:YjiS-like domain-containing protein n=1 Tax=Litoreibacter roseus TaxID=2601869 RepID=A0A6N6JBB6_9RHOB|nr:DUF1127 domain-containing protein [Litoreibacter roseus]GFE63541.1 hypothetical protein KIN_06150 [Litoreibacter roseus]